MRILNLFAGIGGNRTLWGSQHEITAIENDQQIALIYAKRFPTDKVIVCDAWQYFLDHFHEFEIIFAWPPCISHTILNNIVRGNRYSEQRQIKFKMEFPDLRLYSLILFLKHQFKGNWIVENVKPYYKPLIKPTCVRERHFYWSNVSIPDKSKTAAQKIEIKNINKKKKELLAAEIPLLKKINRKSNHSSDFRIKTIINNMIAAEEGKLLLDYLTGKYQMKLNREIEAIE